VTSMPTPGRASSPGCSGGDQRGELDIELPDLFGQPLVTAGQPTKRGLGSLERVSEIRGGAHLAQLLVSAPVVRPRSCWRSSAGPVSDRARS
jgi:hypothetical protein